MKNYLYSKDAEDIEDSCKDDCYDLNSEDDLKNPEKEFNDETLDVVDDLTDELYNDEDVNNMEANTLCSDDDKPINEYASSGEGVREQFRVIMDDYHSSDNIKRENALIAATRLLDGFVHLIIRRSYSTYAKNYFTDLLQEGYLGIMVGMEKYNPDLSMPTTFFFPYIKHEMQGFITRNVDKTTSHYSSNIKKINRAIAEFDSLHRQYTNIDLAIQTGMTIETVNQSMSIRNYRDEVHLDGCPGSVIDDKSVTKVKTPEEMYLEKEQTEIIYRAINRALTPTEISVLEMHFGINGHDTYAEGDIAKKLQIPKDKVKKLINSAIRKLKDSELGTAFSDHLKGQKGLIQDTCITFVPKDVANIDIEQLEAIEIDF